MRINVQSHFYLRLYAVRCIYRRESFNHLVHHSEVLLALLRASIPIYSTSADAQFRSRHSRLRNPRPKNNRLPILAMLLLVQALGREEQIPGAD